MARVNIPSKSVFQSSGEDHKNVGVGVRTGLTGCVEAHPSVSKTPKFWYFVSHFFKVCILQQSLAINFKDNFSYVLLSDFVW